jgi:RNA polymerase sigma-70 factor, ECF subfamily
LQPIPADPAFPLQSVCLAPFSLQKFLNTSRIRAVFMREGKELVAGEAILNRAASMDRSKTDTRRNAGVEEIIDSLVREHSRMVYRIAFAALGSHPDAEDATQETFLRVLRYSSRLARIEEPKAWLARIAWRVAVDRGRQRGRRRDLFSEDRAEPIENAVSADMPADEVALGAQFQTVVEQLVRALPAKLREPLVLSAIQEMSSGEVAAALGINEAAVRSRVFRARQILKDKLAEHRKRTG